MRILRRRVGDGVPSELCATYAAMLVPVNADTREAVIATAGELAASRDAIIEAITVIEVPHQTSLDSPLPEEESAALDVLDRARRIAEAYGARVITYSVRGRRAGEAIIEEATRMGVEVIILGAPAGNRIGRPLMGSTSDFVLRNSPCRVIITAEPPDAQPLTTERAGPA